MPSFIAKLAGLFLSKPKFTSHRCALCPQFVDLAAQLQHRGFICSPCFKLHTQTCTPVDVMERFPSQMAAWGKWLRQESNRDAGGLALDMGEQYAAAQDLMSESVKASLKAFELAKAGRYVEHQELSKRAAELKRQADELVGASEAAIRELNGEARA